MFPFPVELQPVWVYQAEAIAAVAGAAAVDYSIVTLKEYSLLVEYSVLDNGEVLRHVQSVANFHMPVYPFHRSGSFFRIHRYKVSLVPIVIDLTFLYTRAS
jgi:hypothetical protein